MTETLTISDGTVDVDFVTTKTTTDGRERINDDTTLLEPEMLVIRHSVATNGSGNPSGTKVDRHLVQLSHVNRDSDTEAAYTAIVNLTISVPRSSSFSVSDITRLVTLCQNAVTTRISNLLRGES